jgi:hypothetical protein
MITDIIFRLRSLLQRRRVETDLDDELRFHFEQQVEKHLRSGLTHREAVRRARLFFEPARHVVHNSYLWTSAIEHSAEHFGQLVVYYRANNMVPPESRKR